MSNKNFKRMAYGVGYAFLAVGILYGAFLWSTKETILPGLISVIGGFAIWFFFWLLLLFKSKR